MSNSKAASNSAWPRTMPPMPDLDENESLRNLEEIAVKPAVGRIVNPEGRKDFWFQLELMFRLPPYEFEPHKAKRYARHLMNAMMAFARGLAPHDDEVRKMARWGEGANENQAPEDLATGHELVADVLRRLL